MILSVIGDLVTVSHQLRSDDRMRRNRTAEDEECRSMAALCKGLADPSRIARIWSVVERQRETAVAPTRAHAAAEDGRSRAERADEVCPAGERSRRAEYWCGPEACVGEKADARDSRAYASAAEPRSVLVHVRRPSRALRLASPFAEESRRRDVQGSRRRAATRRFQAPFAGLLGPSTRVDPGRPAAG